MAASFPVTFPSVVTTTPTTTLSDAQHNDNLHVKDRDEIIAVQSKVGLGTASPAASATTALVGTGGTQSGWYQVGPQHLAPGTTTMMRLGGTVLAGTLGSVSITVPAAYAHLRITGTARGNAATAAVRLRFNGDAGSNYYCELTQAGGTVTTFVEELATTGARVGLAPGTTIATGIFNAFEATVFDYTNATFPKDLLSTMVSRVGTATSEMRRIAAACSWTGTVAIGTLTFVLSAGSFLPGTRFDVYGLPTG